MLFLFWVKHLPPAEYEEAILDPASRKGISERGREQTVDRADANGGATWWTCLRWCSRRLGTWLFLTARRRRRTLGKITQIPGYTFLGAALIATEISLITFSLSFTGHDYYCFQVKLFWQCQNLTVQQYLSLHMLHDRKCVGKKPSNEVWILPNNDCNNQ